MTQRLQNKVALITGGTSGIGEASVDLFLRHGAKVVFTGRNAEKGRAMQRALGSEARFLAADVSDEARVKASVEEAINAFGRLDVLFNNAGGPTRGAIDTLTQADLLHATNLLLGSVVFGIKHAAPVMKAGGGGAIINNASVASNRTHMGGYLYSIMKAGVVHATRLAGMELGQYGITVNCVSPGAVATPIFFGGSDKAAAMAPGQADAKLAKLTQNLTRATPVRRSGLPSDVAAAALFLASDEGRYVNCHDLVVDGGMTAGGRVNFE